MSILRGITPNHYLSDNLTKINGTHGDCSPCPRRKGEEMPLSRARFCSELKGQLQISVHAQESAATDFVEILIIAHPFSTNGFHE